MHIIIKEINGFMPDTVISILENEIRIEENNKIKILSYSREQIREIMQMFLDISRDWKDKYIDKGIIDDDIYVITVVSRETKEYYIKNKYPFNWERFVLFRNKLVREEIKLG